MGLFRKQRAPKPLPEGFSQEDIRVEASTCTGERTIGFWSEQQKKLISAELVRTQEDIDRFYEQYGLKRP